MEIGESTVANTGLNKNNESWSKGSAKKED
jgi:hypothetical protein